VGPLVLSQVTGSGKALVASGVIALERLLARVGPLVRSQFTGFGKAFVASGVVVLERLLARVGPPGRPCHQVIQGD